MSDSDTGDDDGGFDKEAERERLREKYEQDQADREATQRMSDLLLKGATMTNTHCDACGDPLFRMNGTTFCPTCHGSPDAVEGTGLDADAGAGGADTSAESAPGTDAGDAADAGANGTDAGSPADRGSVAEGRTEDRSQPRPGSDASAGADAGRADEDATTGDAADRTAGPTREAASGPDRAHSRADRPGREGRSRPSPTGPDRSGAGAPVEGDLEAARTSLAAALERFAREAERTDDPRYARECLEAAREAADALAALRGGR